MADNTCIFCRRSTKMGPTDFTAKDVGDFFPREARRLQRLETSYHIGPYCNADACIDKAVDHLRDWSNSLSPSRDEYAAIAAYSLVISDKKGSS